MSVGLNFSFFDSESRQFIERIPVRLYYYSLSLGQVVIDLV